MEIKWELFHASVSDWLHSPTVRLIDTLGVRLGLLFCKLTFANLAIMLAPVKESALCLMLFTEGF